MNKKMSDKYKVAEIVKAEIPSILTLRLREILKFYKESIIKLRAKGGITPQNEVDLDEDYGIVFSSGSSNTIKINYERKRDIDGTILNPLNNAKINDIIEYLDKYLPEKPDPKKDSVKYPPDIPIELLTVEIINDKIKELAGTKTNVFNATFKSEKAENENIRKDIHKKNKKSGVYYQGFDIRNLNLLRLIERIKLEEPKRLRNRLSIIYWDGYDKQDLTPKSPTKIAQYIFLNCLPPGYKSLKTYLITKEDKLELDGYEVG